MSTEDTRRGSTYLNQLVLMRDRIAGFAGSLSIPTARNLIIRSKTKTGNSIATSYLKIDPTPIIDRVSPRIASAFNNSSSITIKLDDLQVKGISRSYSREQILGTGISYFVDSDLVESSINGGFECDLVSVDELPLTWNLILRRKTDDRRNV